MNKAVQVTLRVAAVVSAASLMAGLVYWKSRPRETAHVEGNSSSASSANNAMKHASITGVATAFSVTNGNEDAGARFWVLLNGQFIPGTMLINPQDSLTAWTSGSPVTHQLTWQSLGLSSTKSGPVFDGGRPSEWRDNANSQAILLGDRNAADAAVQSVWTTEGGDWRGNLVWDDNSAGFEQSARGFTTRYQTAVNTNDNLFASSSATATNAPPPASAPNQPRGGAATQPARKDERVLNAPASAQPNASKDAQAREPVPQKAMMGGSKSKMPIDPALLEKAKSAPPATQPATRPAAKDPEPSPPESLMPSTKSAPVIHIPQR